MYPMAKNQSSSGSDQTSPGPPARQEQMGHRGQCLPAEIQTATVILKVHIHCLGCKEKVKKLLLKLDGVCSVEVDAEQGKVVVWGAVADPQALVRVLSKSGKHAEVVSSSGDVGAQRLEVHLQQMRMDKAQRKADVTVAKVHKENEKQTTRKASMGMSQLKEMVLALVGRDRSKYEKLRKVQAARAEEYWRCVGEAESGQAKGGEVETSGTGFATAPQTPLHRPLPPPSPAAGSRTPLRHFFLGRKVDRSAAAELGGLYGRLKGGN